MNKDLVWKIVPIIGAVILVLGVVGMLLFTGKDVSIESVIALIVAAAGALGLGAGALRNGGNGAGGAIGGGILLIVAAALLSGCAANPCLAERSTVAALGVAVELANGAIPSNVDGRDEALDAARAAVQLGAGAVDGCEALRDNSGWMAWLSIGVNAIKAILELVRSVGVDLPPNVAEMLEDVEAAVEAQGG